MKLKNDYAIIDNIKISVKKGVNNMPEQTTEQLNAVSDAVGTPTPPQASQVDSVSQNQYSDQNSVINHSTAVNQSSAGQFNQQSISQNQASFGADGQLLSSSQSADSVAALGQSVASRGMIGESKNFLGMALDLFTKPGDLLSVGLQSFDNIKNSLLASVIVIVLASVISLGAVVISAVTAHKALEDGAKSYFGSDYSSYFETDKSEDEDGDKKKKTASIRWENLKTIKFAEIVPKMLIGYGLIVFGIAFVFFIGGLIAQRTVSFAQTLGVSSLALLPYILISLIVAPLMTKVNFQIGMFTGQLGMIFAAIIIYEGMNNLIFSTFDSKKIIINLGCVLLIVIGLSYINKELLLPATQGVKLNSLSSQLKDATDKLRNFGW